MRTVLVAPLAPGRVSLAPGESHHLLHVLRLARGGRIRVADGAGRFAQATLVDVEGGTAVLLVEPPESAPPPQPTEILLSLPKAALVEEAITLGTELGVTAFRLVRTDRSPPGTPRIERLERVVDAALKQCRRADRPLLAGFADLRAAVLAAPPLHRFVAAFGGHTPTDAWAAANAGGVTGGPAPRPMILAIGCEGGFAPSELDLLVGSGFHPVDLGNHVLRAPTAAAVGLGMLRATER